jgi:hypothetical protein
MAIPNMVTTGDYGRVSFRIFMRPRFDHTVSPKQSKGRLACALLVRIAEVG